MNSTQQALLDAHIKFELTRIKSNTNKDIQQITDNLFDVFDTTVVNDWSNADHVKAFIKAFITDADYENQTIEIIEQILSAIYKNAVHNNTSVTDLIPEKRMNAYVDITLSLPDLREDIIHAAISSKTYHEVIAELLYSGIVSYLTEGNVIAEKVPGAKKMMAVGKGLLNKAAPKLEERVEAQVKKFISTNLGDVVLQSETILLKEISEEQLSSLYMMIWKDLGKHAIADGKRYLPEEATLKYAKLIYEDFITLKSDDFFVSLTESGVDAFYAYYGQKKMSQLCADWGISKDKIVVYFQLIVPQIIDTLEQSGFLEEWIKERLHAFYSSEQAANIFTE